MAPDDKDGSDYRATLVKYWMEKAWESFEAAKSDYASNRLSTAVRNIYYGCFYALTALFYKQGKSFRKHTAVRAALHRDLIKTGKIDAKWGRFYNRVFDRRQEGDYEPLVTFDPEQVEQFIQEANKFIREMDRRLKEYGSTE
jgi:uncharacterized protein (UPF0332 family)